MYGSLHRGTTVSCQDVSYSVKASRDKTKTILEDVSCLFQSGMNAIMGPTGAGKSTLLDILAHRVTKDVTGSVYVDGYKQPENFHLLSGYVTQDDVVMGTLTVRENIAFSAALRLPRGMPVESRDRRVEDLLHEMQLMKVANSKVGTAMVRGISGGERKRTAICMELVNSPQVLFLDEPTTGLDAATATDVMRLLKRSAHSGLTIIFSIHQPRYSIFKLFDSLTLLKAGRVVYHGLNDEALPYFESLGYQCGMHNNPADFFLDILNATKQFEGLSTKMLGGCTKSNFINMELKIEEVEGRKFDATYETSFCKQLYLVSSRALKNYFREPRLAASQLLFMLYFALWLGAAFYQLGHEVEALQNRSGAFYYIMDYAMWNNIDIAPLFIDERPVFTHESANGYYRVSAYFLAKVLADFVIIRTIPYLFFCAFTYLMMGLQSGFSHFFSYFITIVSVSFASCGIMIFISCTTNSAPLAHMLITVPMVLSLILGGFMVNLKDLPTPLYWLKYTSIVQYGYTNLQLNEMHGLSFTCKTNTTYCPSGDSFLESQGMDVRTFWSNIAILDCIGGVFLFLAYILLRRMARLH